MRLKIAALILLVIASCLTSSAQDHRWTFDAGGGFSPLLGDLTNYLQNGWNIRVGAGYNYGPGISASIHYMYNSFGISPLVMHDTHSSSGDSHVWSLTLDPKLTLRYVGKVRPFVVGGVGYYRRTNHLTNPSFVPAIGNGAFSSVGGSLGGGFDIDLRDTGLKIFSELRYHYAPTGRVAVRMIPATVGVRW